jgi:hypothetical protein
VAADPERASSERRLSYSPAFFQAERLKYALRPDDVNFRMDEFHADFSLRLNLLGRGKMN